MKNKSETTKRYFEFFKELFKNKGYEKIKPEDLRQLVKESEISRIIINSAVHIGIMNKSKDSKGKLFYNIIEGVKINETVIETLRNYMSKQTKNARLNKISKLSQQQKIEFPKEVSGARGTRIQRSIEFLKKEGYRILKPVSDFIEV